MKKTSLLLLCLMFTFSVFAQIPPFVDVQEWKVKDQAKAFELMNTWKELEKSMVENAPTVFLLSEMDGNTIYFCRAFKSMEERVKMAGTLKFMKNGAKLLGRTHGKEQALMSL